MFNLSGKNKQSLHESGGTTVQITYDKRSNDSKITVKESGERPRKGTKEGKISLYVRTNDGNLEYEYL